MAAQNATRTDQGTQEDASHICVCPTCGDRHLALRTLGERICLFCGHGFYPARGHALYCSSKCRKDAWTERKMSGAT